MSETCSAIASDPNSSNLYAGISGVQFPVNRFDFGHGVILSKTFAHLMAPFLLAFAPAEPGKPHPAPWKPASGGLAFDIHAELHIPLDLAVLPQWFDRLNTVWWVTALMRLKASPLIFVPVISNESFSAVPSLDHEPRFWPIEVHLRRLMPEPSPARTTTLDALTWVRDHWIRAGVLMHDNDTFNVAFQAFDQTNWTSSPSLALVSLWGALERLFCPSQHEITFRISATIAAYLEGPGKTRVALYKQVRNLYKARSKVAHGSKVDDAKPLIETYALMKRVLVRIIGDDHIPTTDELESNIFSENNAI